MRGLTIALLLVGLTCVLSVSLMAQVKTTSAPFILDLYFIVLDVKALQKAIGRCVVQSFSDVVFNCYGGRESSCTSL